MRAVPVVAVLIVVLEFVALFCLTWAAWFVLITLYGVVTRRTEPDTGEPLRVPPDASA